MVILSGNLVLLIKRAPFNWQVPIDNLSCIFEFCFWGKIWTILELGDWIHKFPVSDIECHGLECQMPRIGPITKSLFLAWHLSIIILTKLTTYLPHKTLYKLEIQLHILSSIYGPFTTGDWTHISLFSTVWSWIIP